MYIAYPTAGHTPAQVHEALQHLMQVANLYNVSGNVLQSALALKPKEAKAGDIVPLDVLAEAAAARKAGGLTGTCQRVSISDTPPTWGEVERMKGQPTRRGRKARKIDPKIVQKVKALEGK